MKINNHYHLTYCTNIHPGEKWTETFEQLNKHIPAIKQKIAPGQIFGLGLRLSNQASYDLLDYEKLDEFNTWLKDYEMYVACINGFPYGSFHNEQIKSNVFAPDWTDDQRTIYTKRLVEIFDNITPNDICAGISTCPVSYKPWLYNYKMSRDDVFRQAAFNLLIVVKDIYQLWKNKGKTIYIEIEPEPDGLLENSHEVIEFFEKWLIPYAKEEWKNDYFKNEADPENVVKYFIRICYDVCHFAVNFEDQQEAINRLASYGIKIGRFQISSALKVNIPQDKKEKNNVRKNLEKFQESTYLHQVKFKNSNGQIIAYPDLPQALIDYDNFVSGQMRSHFHVPVFTKDYGQLSSTQDDIIKILNILSKNDVANILEIETYTWDVLPQEYKIALQDSIVRELDWVKNELLETS